MKKRNLGYIPLGIVVLGFTYLLLSDMRDQGKEGQFYEAKNGGGITVYVEEMRNIRECPPVPEGTIVFGERKTSFGGPGIETSDLLEVRVPNPEDNEANVCQFIKGAPEKDANWKPISISFNCPDGQSICRKER